MKKRFISIVLTLVMLAGIFILPVSATEITSVVADPDFNFSNNEAELKAFLTDSTSDLLYTYGAGEGQVALGTQIGTSNWRLRNAAETPSGSIGNSGDEKKLTFGINTGGRLILTPRTATVLNGVDVKYTTEEAAKIPALVLTKDLSNLSVNQRICVEIQKVEDNKITPGIRFMTHNNGQNYYAFVFPGNNTSAAYDVELVKSVNGTVTSLATFGDGTAYKGMYAAWLSLEIIANNGTIQFNTNGNGKKLSGSYTDAEAFNVSGNNSGVWLMGTNGGNNDARKIQFRNFLIQNYAPFVDYYPENIMCVDASENKKADEEGVIDFGKAVPIRKLLYSGEETDKNIFVSSDRTNWYILTNTNQFAAGVWTNDITSTPYRYVKTEGITEDITFLTEVNEISTSVMDDPITLYPRIKHKDAFGTATITSDSNAVDVIGLAIAPASKGSANITATYNVDGTDYFIKVPVNVNGENEFSYVDDISGATAQSLTGLGNQIAGTNWRMRNAAETPDGLMQYGSGEDAKYGINSDGMFLDAVYGSVQRYGDDVSGKIPALVLTEDLSDLEKQHKISFDVKKTNSPIVTPGVRFMVHNGGKNYYALILGGRDYEIGDWELVKSIDGEISRLKRGSVTDYPAFAMQKADTANFWNVEITVVNNEINFTVTQANNSANTFSSSYTDGSMFDVSGNNAGVWLMAMNGNSSARNAAFKNFKIENYVPYISGYEPSNVVYRDAAEGKTADADGVIDLGEEYTVRKILASGTGNAYISKDKVRWFNIGALSNGAVLNTLTEQGVRYVKADSGITGIKALTEISQNHLKMTVGDELTLYPFINGKMTDITLSSSSENLTVDGFKVTAVGKESEIVLTASNADGDSIDIVCDVTSELNADFSYVADESDPTKWNFTIEAPCAKNGTYTVIIAHYHADGSMSDVQLFENVAFNGEGVATLTADAVTLQAGDFGKGFVWSNTEDLVPVTEVGDIN